MGRIPTGSNFEYMKSIKLNKVQVDNWDSKRVKAFLDNIDKFKRLYEIMNLWLIGKMTQAQIASIPNNVLEEIEQIEEEFNFE